ncbi:BABA1 protein, partial [Rhodinocichla rosea]|nr:BABA1 protein [Rhodinocichla rosea]
MDTSEPGSAAEDEEEKVPEVRPRTRSNPEGAEDRAPSGPGGVGSRGEAPGNRGEAPGNRSEGEGEAASAGHSPPGQPGTAWHGPGSHGQHGEVTVRTPRVNCPEKVVRMGVGIWEWQRGQGWAQGTQGGTQRWAQGQGWAQGWAQSQCQPGASPVPPQLSGFTSDPREVCSCLYDLDTVVCQSFSILPQQKVELPVTDNVQTIPPPFVVRTILVFGRPRCQPHFCGGEHVKVWDTPKSPPDLRSGQAKFNPIMSPPQDMFGFFGSLDTKGTNYKYEVALAGPALELHNCMAKLLAHPLQRPCQSHAHYGLLDGGDSPEGEATN